jgi:hypothetical protein
MICERYGPAFKTEVGWGAGLAFYANKKIFSRKGAKIAKESKVAGTLRVPSAT